MDKFVKFGLLIMVLLALTACGAQDSVSSNIESEEAPQSDTSDSVGTSIEEDDSQTRSREELRADFADNALPPASQLILGTFMLEDTEFAVDVNLAPNLVPYWKLYKSLLESDTTAPEELEALIAEIQEVMGSDQVSYIAGLELTQEDLMTYLNESGIMENLRPEGTEDGDGTRPNRPDGMPEGMGPGGGQGGGPGAAEGMDPELLATMQAEREEMGGAGGFGANRMIGPLIEALIELLESKAG